MYRALLRFNKGLSSVISKAFLCDYYTISICIYIDTPLLRMSHIKQRPSIHY
jgi:hypothetical protein